MQKKIAVYGGEKLACGSLIVKVADLLKMEAVEVTRQVVLESERVQVKLKTADNNLVAYTISVNISREPVSAEEKQEAADFAAGVEKRQEVRKADEAKTRQDAIKTAYEYGKDAGEAGLRSLKHIVPAIKVLRDLTDAGVAEV